jgi:hypothetical protein
VRAIRLPGLLILLHESEYLIVCEDEVLGMAEGMPEPTAA